MFYEKALITNTTLSHSLNTCKSGEWALQKEGNIFVKRMGTIKLEFICHSFVLRWGGGGGGIYFFLLW